MSFKRRPGLPETGRVPNRDASFLPVNDPFLATLDIRVIPLFAPGTVARGFVDVHYTDADNNYQREERIELLGNATEQVALQIALLNPALRSFRHRISIVTADGGLIQRAPVDGEETLIGVGL